ncbi:hypothetical protein OF83DRAFT_1102148 [Amylostereum chailletii]|nr:hypothetical protein OF83DRAFT_1102148 [Amylostereum chailletii]
MNSRPLVVPFTFPNVESPSDLVSSTLRPLVDLSCSEATPSCIIAWNSGPDDPNNGVIFGCTDGSLCFFNATPREPAPLLDLLDITTNPRNSRAKTPSQAHHSHRSRSRSTTPSTLNPTFSPLSAISSRARVVSGISSEQAQAPKNFVDFDEEPDKLKGMLKHTGVRETSVADRLMGSFERRLSIEKTTRPTVVPPHSSDRMQHDEARSLLSATQSGAATPKSISSPPSPAFSPSHFPSTSKYQLTLHHHVFPTRFGSGPLFSVTALQRLGQSDNVVSLQVNGDLSIFCLGDGSCSARVNIGDLGLKPPPGTKEVDHPEIAWRWKRMYVEYFEEATILFAFAALDEMTLPAHSSLDNANHDEQYCSRVAAFELRHGPDQDHDTVSPAKIGDWVIDGNVNNVGIITARDGSRTAYLVDASCHFIIQEICLAPPIVPAEGTPLQSDHDQPLNIDFSALNPFKSSNDSSKENVTEIPNQREDGRVTVGASVNFGEISHESVEGLRLFASTEDGTFSGVYWTGGNLHAFRCSETELIKSPVTMPCDGLRDVSVVSHDLYTVIFSDCVQYFKLVMVDANNDELSSSGHGGILSIKLLATVVAHKPQVLAAASPSTPPRPVTNWKALHKGRTADSHIDERRVTCLLPLELTQFILGFSNGTVGLSSFTQMSSANFNLGKIPVSEGCLDGYITGLHLVHNERTSERLIVGGADDGSIAVWALDSIKMLARWTIFISPLSDVVQLRQEKGGPFWGCILCISLDGTIAVITMDDYQFLYMIPGAQAPLSKICVSGESLLLVYKNDRARLWDPKTREFRRSMTLDRVGEVLGQNGWTVIPLDASPSRGLGGIGPLSPWASSGDSATTLLVDIEQFVTRAMSMAKALPSNEHEENPALPPTIDILRHIIAALITPGLSPEVDAICKDVLRIPSVSAGAGFHSASATSLIPLDTPHSPWCVSEDVSSARALAIVACLRSLSHFEDSPDDVNKVINFYASSLGHLIGERYRAPSLAYLARWWFDTSFEVRSAARTLFDAGVASLSLEETISLVDRWQHRLPCLQPDAEQKSPTAALALLLCGYIAAHKFSLLSSNALNDVSKSIVMYLHDDDISYKATAIDLCSRGFHIWQQYIDAMEMLRSLFTLATSGRKESVSTQNVGPHARQAVLHIVTNNTALFMTTLSLDIMNAQDVEHRRSVMQLVAFLIRKQPLIIYPNLPRLVEAVVKSLDPNSNTNRDAVLDTATEILGHVVKTFPSVDFHMGSQRLAVGTSEGAIVMYDLKTATRLYVLECHKRRPAACSFSPDGRRLVTVSLEEGVVLVWKVGSSFSSFFNPGAPPRQGHSGSDPFKSLSFNVGAEADMSVEESLTAVNFEWAAERSVRLKIKGVTLTFST